MTEADKKTAAEETEEKEIRTEENAAGTAKKGEKTAKDKKEKKDSKKKAPKEETPAEPEAEVITETAPERDYDKELAAAEDRYLRLCAEYDNFRKRSQREKDSLYGDIKADTVAKFLPVYDNLARALAQNTEDEAYRKGVELIMSQFCSTLEKLGVTKTESLGQTFDPSLHNAVMHEDNEELGENVISQVFQEGFMLGDKVIRFAMVKVAN